MAKFVKFKTRESKGKEGAFDILHVPIFKLGNHREFDFDEEWAKKTIKNHKANANKDGYLPTVFVGHWGVERERIAYLDNLKVEDGVLYADLTEIDDDNKELFLKEKYPHRSIEVWETKYLISGLALLGSSEPYHKLPAMKFEEGKEECHIIFANEVDGISIEDHDNFEDNGGQVMTNEERKALFDAEFKAKFGKTPEEFAAEQETARLKSAQEAFQLRIENLKSQSYGVHKVAPVVFDELMQPLFASGEKVKFGEKEMSFNEGILHVMGEIFSRAADGKLMVDLGETAHEQRRDTNVMGKNFGEGKPDDRDRLTKKAEARAKKDKIEFSEALNIILEEEEGEE